jgi:CDP-diglyceride synthetase
VFGDNKTVRGFVVMVPATAAAFWALYLVLSAIAPSVMGNLWQASARDYAVLGAWAGLGFMLGELPNSFIKRQLDVAPGQAPRGRTAALVSFMVDRLDSIVGGLLAITLAAPTPWFTWALVILIGPAIHFAFSVLLYRLGVKERAA